MTYQEANALVDDFSFVYKGESISKEALIECRETIHTALEKQIPKTPKPVAIFSQNGKPLYYKVLCPNCHIKSYLKSIVNFCPNCGQALYWSKNWKEII